MSEEKEEEREEDHGEAVDDVCTTGAAGETRLGGERRGRSTLARSSWSNDELGGV